MIEWPLKWPFLFLCITGDALATEYSTDPVLELSHAAVSTKSLFHVYVNKVVVVVFWKYDVFEFNEPSVVSFPQKVVDDDSLSVEVFFCQTASEATSFVSRRRKPSGRIGGNIAGLSTWQFVCRYLQGPTS